MSTIFVDLDGTLCSDDTNFGHRLSAKRIYGAREALEAFKAAGHTVVVYTARGWNEYEATRVWLDAHEMPYDAIHMGKPIADLWIDDRALQFWTWDQVQHDIQTRNLL